MKRLIKKSNLQDINNKYPNIQLIGDVKSFQIKYNNKIIGRVKKKSDYYFAETYEGDEDSQDELCSNIDDAIYFILECYGI